MQMRRRRPRILDGARGAWQIGRLIAGEGIARNVRRTQPGPLARGGLPLRYARDLVARSLPVPLAVANPALRG
jgi:hypothetical protein